MLGDQAVDAVEGDVVHVREGAEHWLGAQHEEQHSMRQLALSFGHPTWPESVSAEKYSAG